MNNSFKLTLTILGLSFSFFWMPKENKKNFKSSFWIDEQKVYWEELLNKDKNGIPTNMQLPLQIIY